MGDLAATIAEVLEEVRALRAEVAALRGTRPSDGPIYVDAAADLLGVSRETLDRTIRKLPTHKRPAHVPTPNAKGKAAQRHRYFWLDADDLRTWWSATTAPAAPRQHTRKPRVELVDWNGGAA